MCPNRMDNPTHRLRTPVNKHGEKFQSLLWGGYSVVEAPDSVKVVVWDRYPLITPMQL